MNLINFKYLFKYVALTVVSVGFTHNMGAMQQPARGAKKTVNNNGVKRQARINGKALINVVADRAKLIVEMLELIKKSPVEQVEGLDQVSADLLKKAYAEYHNKINNKENAADALCAYGYVIDTIIKRQQEIVAQNIDAHQNVVMSYVLAPFRNIYKGFYAEPDIKTALKGVAGLGLYAGIICGVGSVLWKHILSGPANLSEQENDDEKKARLAREGTVQEQEAERLEQERLAREHEAPGERPAEDVQVQRERDMREFGEALNVIQGVVIAQERLAQNAVGVARHLLAQVINEVERVLRAGNRENYDNAMAEGREEKIAYIRDSFRQMAQAARGSFEHALDQIPHDEEYLRPVLQAGCVALDQVINRELENLDGIAALGVSAEADRLARLFAQVMQQMQDAIAPYARAQEDILEIRLIVRRILENDEGEGYLPIRDTFGDAIRQGYIFDEQFMALRYNSPIAFLHNGFRVIVQEARGYLVERLAGFREAEARGNHDQVERQLGLEAGLAVFQRETQRLFENVAPEGQAEAERLVGVFADIMQQTRNAAAQAEAAQRELERQQEEQEREQWRAENEERRRLYDENARREEELWQVQQAGLRAQAEAERRAHEAEQARLEQEQLIRERRDREEAQQREEVERARQVALELERERALALQREQEVERVLQEELAQAQRAEQERVARERREAALMAAPGLRHEPIIRQINGVETWYNLVQQIRQHIIPGRTLIAVDIDGTVGVKVVAGKDERGQDIRILLPIEGAAEALQQLRDAGAILVALTIRGYEEILACRAAGQSPDGANTLLDLLAIGIDYGTPVERFGLRNFENVPGAGYYNGVIFSGKTTGYGVRGKKYAAKGLALREFLNANPQLEISKIIFIDDELDPYIESVKVFLQEAQNYDGFLFEFIGGQYLTRLAQLREAGNDRDYQQDLFGGWGIFDHAEKWRMLQDVQELLDQQIAVINPRYLDLKARVGAAGAAPVHEG